MAYPVQKEISSVPITMASQFRVVCGIDSNGNAQILRVDTTGALVLSNSGISSSPLIQALLSAVLNFVGGVFSIASATTGTLFLLALEGPANAPTAVILAATTFIPAFTFPDSSSGQAILRNLTTGTAFPVVLTGADANPTFAILPPGSAIPAVTYETDAMGNITLLNQTTGNFLSLFVTGPDTAPKLAFA